MTIPGMGINTLTGVGKWLRQAGAATRQMIAGLAFSAAGLVGLAVHEGYSERAYPDPVKGTAVPTLGFGTTEGVRMGDITTPVKALERKLADVRKFEGALKRCVKVPLHQHEYDAYINLSYNVGSYNFCFNKEGGPSTLVARLNAEDYRGACDAILLYDRAGPVNAPRDRCSHPDNRTCRGVWKRRLQVHQQCLGGSS